MPDVLTAEVTQAVRAAGGRKHINVVLFSGGSGTHTITEALRKHPQIRLRILINAYDDGHSTGRLRKFIPGMLGPSDVRKNLNRLMPSAEMSHQKLKMLADYRMAVGISRADAGRLMEQLIRGERVGLPPVLADAYRQLTVGTAERLQSFLTTFETYRNEQERQGGSFDFTDCAIGNLLFAGCYLEQGRDFNRTIAEFSRFHDVAPDALLNVTQGENLFLVAEKEDGTVLVSEGAIVASQTTAKIAHLYLCDEAIYRSQIEDQPPPAEGWLPLIRQAARVPRLNAQAAAAIAEADVVLYGPGTQHSSLFPSYMTDGVAEAIAANREADKIFVGNIRRDLDIQKDDVNDLARKFMNTLRRGTAPVEWRDCVTHFFVQNSAEIASAAAEYIPFDPAHFPFPLDTVRLNDWECQAGRHAGGFVLDELQRIVQSRIDIELESVQHMVSIVIPVLNEERTLEEVLKSVQLLDFQALGLTKEVIVIDGGSTDRSLEIAQSLQPVRAYRVVGETGRGAALRMGISKARGNLIAFFPGDREYRTADLHAMVGTLMNSRFRAVFGTRAMTVRDLSEQLSGIYDGKRGLYLTSKYGGMVLSIMTLLLYDRYVSDVLTSVKVFDARLLQGLQLERSGRDLDTEIVAKLGRQREYILEHPVEYQPRTRAEGKKITLSDGFQALLSLVQYRFGRRGAESPAALQANGGSRLL